MGKRWTLAKFMHEEPPVLIPVATTEIAEICAVHLMQYLNQGDGPRFEAGAATCDGGETWHVYLMEVLP